MSIGTIIKRLRRDKDITQEQLAEYLGITSRAVSQWECDRTSPDISQIPALCNIFDVSSDILLGIDIKNSNEEIKRYLAEANELLSQGKHSERTALLREAKRKFPRDYKIIGRLADSLVSEYSRNSIGEYNEVIDLCNRILAECTDSTTRYEAINTLGTAYVYAGKKDEVMKLAEEMPHARFSYEHFMLYRWKGDSGFDEFQNYMSFMIYNTINMIEIATYQFHDNNEYIYTIEDKIHLWKTEVALLELFFPKGDFQFNAQLGEIACSNLCSAYLKRQDYKESWYWLEKGVDFAIHMDTYDFNAAHTSPILRGYSSGGWIMEEGKRSQVILKWLTTDDESEVLRSDWRYTSIVDRLENAGR